MHFFHLSLSLDAAELFHPSCNRSCYSVLFHVIFNRPTFFFSSKNHAIAVVHILMFVTHSIWSIKFLLPNVIISLVFTKLLYYEIYMKFCFAILLLRFFLCINSGGHRPSLCLPLLFIKFHLHTIKLLNDIYFS